MKKISLSIPKPCHENWDAMTPDAKGRFCGSCQKSVVDFSLMNDRQIADFFKKPVGSVCGRFHSEQLDREIDIPRKRIPWVRYFFTISLPAFLASCKFLGKEATQGKVFAAEQHLTGDTVAVPLLPMMGKPLPQINAVDSSFKKKPQCKVQKIEGYTVGELPPPPIQQEETKGVLMPPASDTLSEKEAKPMDTVNIVRYNSKELQGIAGGVTVVRTRGKAQKPIPLTEAPKVTTTLIAYPNPVRAGEKLTLSFSGDETVKALQLFTSSGALLQLQQSVTFNNKKAELLVPASMAADTYFVRLTTKENKIITAKIIVLN